MEQNNFRKYDMAITSYTESTAIPTSETRIWKSFKSEATLETMKRYRKPREYIKGYEKCFSETIEVKRHVHRNYISTVVCDTAHCPRIYMSGITVQIYPQAIPKETMAMQNILNVWGRKR
ncbi:uncharacterized protein LOC129967146 isoform X2 [Argiope bruennichi]|uniref:uncharacterized protein LOC129967146 isoform X2 n=1 Tax=Argiope bruennichi TaxID=94029 RepID=UPI0024959831|nr:uncharacterized protein LOC129967146 isoform X2 [Argiope bruennichi]